MKALKARMVSATDNSLTLVRAQKTIDTSRGDVLKVFRLIGKTRKRTTLIGLAVGAGAGAGVGAATGRDLDEGGAFEVAAVVAILGAGIGSLAGFLVGSGQERILILAIPLS